MKLYFLIGHLNIFKVNGSNQSDERGRCSFGTKEEGPDPITYRPSIDPPFRCVDVNECVEGTHDCDVDATCTNLKGGTQSVKGFTCQCNTGKRSKIRD